MIDHGAAGGLNRRGPEHHLRGGLVRMDEVLELVRTRPLHLQ
jgi:hypothetical protein